MANTALSMALGGLASKMYINGKMGFRDTPPALTLVALGVAKARHGTEGPEITSFAPQ